MKPIAPEDWRLANIRTGAYAPVCSDAKPDSEVRQVNPNRPTGCGFLAYRVAPGHVNAPHSHDGDEEVLVLEGEIVDHHGYRYGPGDLIRLRDGTEHCSRSPDACLLAVGPPGVTAIWGGT